MENFSPNILKTKGSLWIFYLNESNFFVISSDFCHWGSRFDYQYYEPEQGPIFKSIEALDKRGMEIIASQVECNLLFMLMESQDVEKFYAYQKKYKNTICGRHPIGVLLQVEIGIILIII